MLLQPRAYLHLPKQHRTRQRRPIQSRRTRHPRRVQHFKKICAVEGVSDFLATIASDFQEIFIIFAEFKQLFFYKHK